jgi:hypothetical protein
MILGGALSTFGFMLRGPVPGGGGIPGGGMPGGTPGGGLIILGGGIPAEHQKILSNWQLLQFS